MVYNAGWTSQARKKRKVGPHIKPSDIRKKKRDTTAKKKKKEGKLSQEVMKMPTGHRVEKGE